MAKVDYEAIDAELPDYLAEHVEDMVLKGKTPFTVYAILSQSEGARWKFAAREYAERLCNRMKKGTLRS